MLLNPLQARRVLTHAVENRYAILAINADSPAAITDALEAARRASAPVMVETSLWQLTGHSFGAGDAVLGMARYLAQLAVLAESARFRSVPVFYHTDHIKGPEALPLLKKAIEGVPLALGGATLPLAASTLSLDSSSMTEEQNIATACELCAHAALHGRPLTLEIESGVDDGVTPLDVATRLISPVERAHPGCLALWAPGVGTQHGLGGDGYPTFSPEAVARHQAEASRLCGRPIGIALHGSSGLPEASLRAAVQSGVAKVNWSSESLLYRSTAAAEFYRVKTAELERTHARWKAHAMDNGLQQFVSERYLPRVVERMEILGSADRNSALAALLGLAA